MFFIIYWIISPIIWVIIPFASLFNPKIRHHFIHYKKSIRYAKTKINQNKKNKKVVLFHAASTGEFEQLKPILKLINREKYFILVSFSSPTAFIPENKTTLSDATCYHPFDLFWTAYLLIYFLLKVDLIEPIIPGLFL